MSFTLSNEQTIAFNKYIQGENIFITGPGGTGKTALIKLIKHHADNKGKNIQVCALTGCAAVLLECKARTIHSWAGIGIGSGDIENIIKKVMRNKVAKNAWLSVNILIIDEVSMMSKKLFEVLNSVAQKIRKNGSPFGGMQVIFSGDFYQLPPVGNKDDISTSEFCFQSELWFNMFKIPNHIQLKTIFRQSDPVYQKILNQIREGCIKKSSNAILLNHVNREIPENYQIKPTRLYPIRSKVDIINKTELEQINSEVYTFDLKYRTDLQMTAKERLARMSFTKEQIDMELEFLKNNIRCDSKIELKKGSQIMCIINTSINEDTLLCNGSQGVVIDIVNNLPLIKYQNGVTTIMSYHTWESDKIPGLGVSQLPIIPAWALTIHKSQGATLDVAEIDIGSDIFECGQSYVALSRVKNLDGLYLKSFDVTRIKINAYVKEFYKLLNKLEEEEKEKEKEKEKT